jgi:hypothetical protein
MIAKKFDIQRARLEAMIQRALIDFEDTTGCKIEDVRIDTRAFANLRVNIEIVLRELT